jgi:hypothetical protein
MHRGRFESWQEVRKGKTVATESRADDKSERMSIARRSYNSARYNWIGLLSYCDYWQTRSRGRGPKTNLMTKGLIG